MGLSLRGDDRSGRRRTFLFLQGPSSPLFRNIARHLEQRGHRCLRVNLSTGDWIYWRRKGGFNFRGRLADWPGYVAALMDREGVSDIIFMGEERPHHRLAAVTAVEREVPVFVVDMGYLRPDWIRLERDGSGFHSHFPADPAQILVAGSHLPTPDFEQRYTQTFLADAALDLLYNLSNVLLWFFYPHYRWHAVFHPLAEYWGWIKRLAGDKTRRREAEQTIGKLKASGRQFFVLPLQLETDYQIRAYSSFVSQKDAIKLVVRSFAAHAGSDARLLLKLHPLDNGLIDWCEFAAQEAQRCAVADRVHFVDGGNLEQLLSASAGMVTINSTVGLQALQQGKPVKTLGIAIYDLAGLTSQSSLDAFWQAPQYPDPALTEAFVRLLAASLHVRGNFCSFAGAEAGAAAIAERLHDGTVNQPGGYVDIPPRSALAKSPV